MSDENLVGGIVNAQVSVESLPASRQIVAVERQADGTWRVCGHGQSGADGLAEFSVQARPESTIYALAVDEWGTPWTSGMTVAVGDLVRPTNFVGWLYRATQGGALPVDEPVWWNSSSLGPQPAGTAVLEAERYYQPISHGPLAVEFTDEFDPLWPLVTALLHGDGADNSQAIIDETGRVWTAVGDAKIVNRGGAFGGVISFDGNGDYITTPASADFNFGTKPLCWEFRIKAAATQVQAFPCCLFFGNGTNWGPNSVQVHILRGDSHGNKVTVFIHNYSSSVPLLKSTISVLDDVEHVIAIDRDGSTFRLFIDGIMQDSKVWTGSVTTVAVGCNVGSAGSADSISRATAEMQEIRFTPASRRTENYTPEAEPFLSR